MLEFAWSKSGITSGHIIINRPRLSTQLLNSVECNGRIAEPFSVPSLPDVVFCCGVAYNFDAQNGIAKTAQEVRGPAMPEQEFEHDELVITEEETRLKEPSLYNVLIHNDNFTTMEFVVYVLHHIFQQSESKAVHIMLQVHLEGVGVAGIYPFEIAEMKVAKVTSLAQANEFPLLCTIEQVSV